MAQTSPPDITFGSVKAEDFSPTAYAIDSNAEAVYLFDVGSSYYREDGRANLELVYHRHYRVRIMNQNAFDLATLQLSLNNTEDSKETLTDLSAAVYNLKDGKVASEQIDKNLVFTEKSKEEVQIKLTLPKIVVGSIVEFSYITKQPLDGLPEWSFQGRYPRLWSRYEVVIPYLFNFAILKQGNLAFVVDSTSTFHTDYPYGGYGSHEVNTLQHTWVMKNVPAIAPEPFIGTIDNYKAKIEFQLSAYTNRYGNSTAISQTWANVCTVMMASPAFGFSDEKEKNNLAAIVKTVCKGDTAQIDKSKHIYRYVRDNYTCTYQYGKIRSQNINDLIKTKKGNLADINLLLYSLLDEAGLSVNPVLLSTTGHGKIVYEYPTLGRYNYVICQLIINRKQYLLDAGSRYLPFGGMHDKCYNGYSRVININGSQGIFISPNSVVDSICTNITVNHGKNEAQVTTNFGIQPSIEARSFIETIKNKDTAAILKKLLACDATFTNVQSKNMFVADSNISFTYQVPLEAMDADVVYFSPLLSLQLKSNPFVAATRTYGIEMPFCRKDIFHVSLEIPEGYEPEEIPKPDTLKDESISGEFIYATRIENNTIILDVQSNIGRAVYQPEDYTALRNFYSDILAKEAQQIVFKKKK